MWTRSVAVGGRLAPSFLRRSAAVARVPAALQSQLQQFGQPQLRSGARWFSNAKQETPKQESNAEADPDKAEQEKVDKAAKANIRKILIGSTMGISMGLVITYAEQIFGTASAEEPPPPSPAQLRRMNQQAAKALEEMRAYISEIPEDSEWLAVALKWLARAEEIMADDTLKAEDKAMRVLQCRRYFEAIQQGLTEPKRRGVQVVDDVSFAQEVFNDDKDVVLFLHGGSSCVSCTVGKPRVDMLALALAEVPTLKFVKMNVTEPHCRHISPEDGFVYPVTRVLGGKRKLQAPHQESNVGVEELKICNPSVDVVEAIKLIHKHCDHKFDVDKVLDRLFVMMQYFEDLPDYKHRRPEHLWLPRPEEDPQVEQARRNLARYYYDLRGFEAALADDSAWLKDPSYQAPNGSRSSVLLAQQGVSSRADLEREGVELPEPLPPGMSRHASPDKPEKSGKKQKKADKGPKKPDPNDFLTLVHYIWGPLASQSFNYQAEELVRGFESWDSEAEEYMLNFLENSEHDDTEISVLQFVVQANLARYNALKQVVDSRRNVSRRLSDDLEVLKNKIRARNNTPAWSPDQDDEPQQQHEEQEQ